MNMIHIVGAGPGGVDLITVRGQRLLGEADVVVYAGSLVNKELLTLAKEGALVYDSAGMTLEEVMAVVEAAWEAGRSLVRLHTGDPCIYGAIREQMDWMDEKGISYDICPGVSSFCGAAAALSMEYTLPDVTQSVVITRMEGRTPVPQRESIRSFASHGAAMVIFLSTGMLEELSRELTAGGYGTATPAAIVYKATWPEEKVVRCTVGTLAKSARQEDIRKTALIIVGESVSGKNYERSKLYDPEFTTMFREGGQGPVQEGEIGGNASTCPGVMYVVGMGPGALGQMTGEALEALNRCQVIAGYTVYVDLIREHFPHKKFLTTAMTKEEERCRMALQCCMEGSHTAMICSGDAGVYGMAGLMLELSVEYPGVKVEIVPGVTAACAGASVLGAPLMHDFAVISLSDRLTPLDVIWKRVEMAAEADFVICIYNPASKGRPDYFRQACERILRYRSGDTVCGLVFKIGRDGQGREVLPLGEIKDRKVDMFTTVYIGSSHTKEIGPYMVTPRGYRYEKG